MKKAILLFCTSCALMLRPIAGHAQSRMNLDPVYSAKHFGENDQAKEVERQMRTRNYSSFNQKLEKTVNDAVQSGSSNKSSSGSTNSSSSNCSSGSGNSSNSNKGSSTSTNSGSNQSQTKNNNSEDNGKCTDCSKQAEALKNSRKQ